MYLTSYSALKQRLASLQPGVYYTHAGNRITRAGAVIDNFSSARQTPGEMIFTCNHLLCQGEYKSTRSIVHMW